MTDAEMMVFLGIADDPTLTPEQREKFINGLSSDQRAMFEKMRAVEMWDQGLGPRPDGVIAYGHKHSVFGHSG